MAVDDERDERDEQTPPREQPAKKRGRPRGSTSSKKPTSRFQRRADKASETVRELIHLGRPDLDVSELSFVEVVDRDVRAWGEFLAQLGEWIEPFGGLIDVLFGAALVRVLRMAPSVRAARRELVARRERRAAEREQLAAELPVEEEPQEPNAYPLHPAGEALG